MEITSREIAAISHAEALAQRARIFGGTPFDGWANSATQAAQLYLNNYREHYDSINALAAAGALTGDSLRNYSMTLRSNQFEKEGGRRVAGCGFRLPEWTEGKVDWDAIASHWREHVYSPDWAPETQEAPKEVAAPLADDVLAVLAECIVSQDAVLRLPPRQLDRKLYQAVQRVIDGIGGKWNRSRQGFVFTEGNPEPLIEAIVQTGTFLKVKPENFGFFPTPKGLAAKVAELLEIQPGMKALEPSGGTGALANELASAIGHENVTVVELQEKNVGALTEMGFKVVQGDFLAFRPDELFDRVLMNPPFARQADIDHVNHAWNMVKPGGRLVAIMAASVRFRDNTKTKLFRDLVTNYGELIDNPDGSFKESGTMVRTVTVILDKPRCFM